MPFSVLHPALLAAGVLCATIPILVHLLRRRYQPISWGAMRFLEHALKKRRRRLTLEQILLLTLRVLLVLAIALGVASLVRSGAGATGPRTLVIVLDDSVHAQRRTPDGTTALESSKARALALLDTLNPSLGDRAALITLGAPARAPASPPTSQTDLVRRAIERLEPTDAERDTTGAAALVSAAQATDEPQPTPELAVLATTTGWDAQALTPLTDLELPTTLYPTEHDTSPNTAITDARSVRALLTPNTNEQHGLRVTLARESTDQPTTTTVRILADDDTQLGARTHTWEPGASAASLVIPIDTPSADSSATALRAVIDDDTNQADNQRTATIATRRTLRVGITDRASDPSPPSVRPSRWVRAVLSASDQLVEHTRTDAAVAADRLDPALDAVFVLDPDALDERAWDQLTDMNALGSLIVITPSPNPDQNLAWTQHAAQILALDPERPWTPDVSTTPTSLDPTPPTSDLLLGIRDEFAPLAASVSVTQHLTLPPSEHTLLSSPQGAPLAITNDENSAVLFAFAFDDRWTDLPARPLFVALVQETLRRGVGTASTPETLNAGALGDARTAGITRSADTEIADITRVVNPDARRTADATPSAQTVESNDALTVARADDKSRDQTRASTQAPTLLGSWPFVAALLIAAAEFTLARRCSLRLRPTPEQRP